MSGATPARTATSTETVAPVARPVAEGDVRIAVEVIGGLQGGWKIGPVEDDEVVTAAAADSGGRAGTPLQGPCGHGEDGIGGRDGPRRASLSESRSTSMKSNTHSGPAGGAA
jgi:hypothetical protein